MPALTSRKSAPDEQTRAGIRLLCKTDLYTLVKLVLNEDRGAANAMTESFHKPLCAYVQTTPFRKNLYLVPRGFFKTSLLTVGKNIQRILNDPQIRILIGSNKAENAEAMLREIKGHLQNPKLLWAFPEILHGDPARQSEQWTNSAITVKRSRRSKEATIETIGVSGEVTSKHYEHGTFDDVVGKENSQTREGREDAIGFIRAAESLFDPGATVDYVGTPWHYADAYAWLEEQRDKQGLKLGIYKRACWEPVTTLGEASEVAGPFGRVRTTFPERFPVEELLDIRKTKGPSEFAAQYLMDPISADTAYFPREKLLPNIHPRRDLPDPASCWMVMTIDPAISLKDYADYSAIAVVGWDQQGIMHLFEIHRERWKEHELVDWAYQYYYRYPGIRAIGCESVGFQKLFRSLFVNEGEKRGQHLPVVSLERDTKTAKSVRLRALEPIWHAGELIVAADAHSLEEFIDEASKYRPDRENAHDDMLDAVVDAIQLRLRPDTQAEEPVIDDPDLLERMGFEERITAQRDAQKMGRLDRTSLRVAAMQAQRLRRFEDEAARQQGESRLADFYA